MPRPERYAEKWASSLLSNASTFVYSPTEYKAMEQGGVWGVFRFNKDGLTTALISFTAVDGNGNLAAPEYARTYWSNDAIEFDPFGQLMLVPFVSGTANVINRAAGWGAAEIGLRSGSVVSVGTLTQTELVFTEQQVWKKFGEHFTEFGLSHSKAGMQQYTKIAQEVYRNPVIKYTFPQGGYYAGETWMINSGKLLRLTPKGEFRSLYMLK